FSTEVLIPLRQAIEQAASSQVEELMLDPRWEQFDVLPTYFSEDDWKKMHQSAPGPFTTELLFECAGGLQSLLTTEPKSDQITTEQRNALGALYCLHTNSREQLPPILYRVFH